MYTISKGHDQISGKEYWYCHMKGYSYVPVFGSIGNKAHAKKYADIMNKSNGKSWKQQTMSRFERVE